MVTLSPSGNRNPPESLADILRDYILSGAIEPDYPIRQDALAAEFKVSKIPLREALARLEQDGLVFSKPNCGFFVRPMSAEEAEEIFALRLKLEPHAAAEACLIATESDHQAAREALEAFDVDADAHRNTVGSLNRAFHLALVRPGGNKRITASLVARLHVLADRYVRKHLEPRGRVLRAEAEHHEMLDAWIKRKPGRVRKLIADHLQNTLADLRSALRGAAPKKKAGSRRAG
jgi:DNA-binding GntR family transcriptional regulator